MDVESRTIEATQKLSASAVSEANTAEPAPMPTPTSQPSTEPPPIQPSQNMPQSMPAMPGMAESALSRPATQPAAVRELAVAYCPMAKANWLQPGDAIANPYLGREMPTCGTVQKKIMAPPSDAALAAVVQSYLDVGKALNMDKLDSAALESLNSAASKLSDDRYAALRESSAKIVGAKDLAAARSAFHTFSDQLIALLEKAGQ
jgi:hypothetical protein